MILDGNSSAGLSHPWIARACQGFVPGIEVVTELTETVCEFCQWGVGVQPAPCVSGVFITIIRGLHRVMNALQVSLLAVYLHLS